MKIVEFLPENLVVASLLATNKEGALRELAARVAMQFPEMDSERLVQVLWERERLGSTAIGDGIAIPHGKMPALGRIIGAFGRHRQGLDFQSLDGAPTRLIFLLVAPEESAGIHLKALARVSRVLKDPSFRARLLGAADGAELYRLIREEDDKL